VIVSEAGLLTYWKLCFSN